MLKNLEIGRKKIDCFCRKKKMRKLTFVGTTAESA